MITQLSKSTKVKLLKSIKTGFFNSDDFPELTIELGKYQIELIDKSSDVDRSLYPDGQLLNNE